MTYQALARKYRPQTFHDIVGQETVVRTLQNAIEQQRIHHAYLFSGVRGIGKTTTARLLAKALNCAAGPTIEPDNACVICSEITEGIDMDVREIDAATYTGVDNVRELRDVTQFQPARDRYRIFIIDEAHMLSTPAWNALLKILEEPPSHVVFMFATTEMHKVPATILSRVQKFTLRKITLDELIGRLEEICKAEGIEADHGALEIVARRGEGSVRDALSILDQIIAFSGRVITAAEVATVLGLSDLAFFARVMNQLADGDHAGVLLTLQEAADSGRDFKLLYRDLLSFIRNLLLIAGGASNTLLSLSGDDLALVQETAGRFNYSELLRIANLLVRDDETVNRAEHQRLAVEIALLKAATFPRLQSVEQTIRQGSGSGSPVRSESRLAESRVTEVRRPRAEPPAPRASAPPIAAPAPQRATAPEPASDGEPPRRPAAAAGSGDVATFIQRVATKRRVISSYLEMAKSHRREEGKLVFEFDAGDQNLIEMLNDAAILLDETAAEVFGEPLRVRAEVASAKPQPGRRADDAQSSLTEDPVMKAFAKHLGGEVVQPRSR
jgi:DNA polymerase-3 subunit gamma/tau